MNASTNRNELAKIISKLKEPTPEAKKARKELATLLATGRRRTRGKKLYIAAHVGRPFNVSGVMVNRLALDILQLQRPKYEGRFVRCIGLAKENTTRGIDAYQYTREGIKLVRQEIPKALKKGLIKKMAHNPTPQRRTAEPTRKAA